MNTKPTSTELMIEYRKTKSPDILNKLINEYFMGLIVTYFSYLKYNKILNPKTSTTITSLKRILFNEKQPIPNCCAVLEWLRESYDMEDLKADITVMFIECLNEVELDGFIKIRPMMEKKIKNFIKKLADDIVPNGERVDLDLSTADLKQDETTNHEEVYQKFIDYYKKQGMCKSHLLMVSYSAKGYTDEEISGKLGYSVNYIRKTRCKINKKLSELGIDVFLDNLR